MRFSRKALVISVLGALTGGIFMQFAWKMIYYPEPIGLVSMELVIIAGLTASAIWATTKLKEE